jgi:hypothetical protein
MVSHQDLDPRRAFVRAALVLLAALPVVTPARALGEESCTPLEAAAVVTCLAEAFNQRDAAALDALLDEEFVYVQGETTLDRATHMQSFEKMFRSPLVKEIAFSAEGVSCEPRGGEWIVTVAATKLVVSIEREGKPQEFTVHGNGYRFFVRAVQGTFRIVRWEDPS